MKKPDFLQAIIYGLFLDLILLVLCLFAGYGIYLILAIMLYLVPILVGVLGTKGAVNWTSRECRAEGFLSSLSRLLCGSSLAFLLVATGMEVWGELERGANLIEILAYVYLLVLLMRFSGAGLANLVAAIPCLIFGRGLDRLNALSALLCSAAGLHIVWSLIRQQAAQEYQSMIFFCLINFGYGLVYGGGLQWLARELASPDQHP
jgi:hypothetical protein